MNKRRRTLKKRETCRERLLKKYLERIRMIDRSKEIMESRANQDF